MLEEVREAGPSRHSRSSSRRGTTGSRGRSAACDRRAGSAAGRWAARASRTRPSAPRIAAGAAAGRAAGRGVGPASPARRAGWPWAGRGPGRRRARRLDGLSGKHGHRAERAGGRGRDGGDGRTGETSKHGVLQRTLSLLPNPARASGPGTPPGRALDVTANQRRIRTQAMLPASPHPVDDLPATVGRVLDEFVQAARADARRHAAVDRAVRQRRREPDARHIGRQRRRRAVGVRADAASSGCGRRSNAPTRRSASRSSGCWNPRWPPPPRPSR